MTKASGPDLLVAPKRLILHPPNIRTVRGPDTEDTLVDDDYQSEDILNSPQTINGRIKNGGSSASQDSSSISRPQKPKKTLL